MVRYISIYHHRNRNTQPKGMRKIALHTAIFRAHTQYSETYIPTTLINTHSRGKNMMPPIKAANIAKTKTAPAAKSLARCDDLYFRPSSSRIQLHTSSIAVLISSADITNPIISKSKIHSINETRKKNAKRTTNAAAVTWTRMLRSENPLEMPLKAYVKLLSTLKKNITIGVPKYRYLQCTEERDSIQTQFKLNSNSIQTQFKLNSNSIQQMISLGRHH